ncbi:HK97-gp10 family putative phage morphogenesis protein [Paenibacillus anaericanus]|nr:HK97-gp10 family putative phage morphogenesis protein [Paenibacillus anaericanus]
MEMTGIDAMLADVRRRLGNASAKVERVALTSAGELIAEEERSIVAVSDKPSGTHIQDDIYVTRVMRKEGVKYVLVRQTKKTSWRTHLLEFGTSKMSAQPYKEPAFHARKGAALNIMVETFREGLRG